MRIILLGSVLFLSVMGSALAQDGYVPPPMFDDSLRPESTTGNIVEPRVSPRLPAPSPSTAPAISQPAAAPKSPLPPAAPKFMEPIVETRPAPKIIAPPKPVVKAVETPLPSKPKPMATITPPRKPDMPKTAVLPLPADEGPQTPPQINAGTVKADEPVSPPKPEAAPEARPASKVTSKGVVTGPVTMPAVPTQKVDQLQVVDLTAPIAASLDKEPSAKVDEPTILERHQNQTASQVDEKLMEDAKQADVIANIAASGIEPAVFEPGAAKDVLKKILPYGPGQTELTQEDLVAIGAGILKELDKRDHWRIQIRSYATSQGQGVSSDKRIALSRAIALRHALVKQGVRASRIDVRAEGQQSPQAGLSGDRIDLYLYSPTKKPQIF